MTDSIHRAEPKRACTALVVGGWMLVQAIVLIGTDSVRLWPHHPAPPQSASLIELIVVQVLVVALFCPLIDGWNRVLMMSAGALFFDQIAAIQAAVPVSGAIRVGAATSLWIAAARLNNGCGRHPAKVGPFALMLPTLVPLMLRFGGSSLSESTHRISAFALRGPCEWVTSQIDGCSLQGFWIVVPGAIIFSGTTVFRARLSRFLKPPHFTPAIRKQRTELD